MDKLGKGCLTVIVAILAVVCILVFLPSFILGTFMHQSMYVATIVTPDPMYSYDIINNQIVVTIKNDTDNYYDLIGFRFHLFNKTGIKMSSQQKAISIDVEFEQLKPDESRTLRSVALPVGTVSAQIEKTIQKKVTR